MAEAIIFVWVAAVVAVGAIGLATVNERMVRGPHWEEICTRGHDDIAPVWLDGKTMSFMPVYKCDHYDRQCITGSRYSGSETGCHQ